MPDLLLQPTAAQAARVVAAYRKIPAPDGSLPADNATNAQLWAHVKKVVAGQIIATVKSDEARELTTEDVIV